VQKESIVNQKSLERYADEQENNEIEKWQEKK
jgi:hypothetical protein